METHNNQNKILHISDQSFGYKENTCISGQPDKLIEKIENEFPEKGLFLINVNYSSENIARADNAGILFLKYLRLNHFNQHCVLYSFLSREQLMLQDPHNAIIFSEGVTFIRMPEDLDKLPFEDLKKRKAPDDLSDYFKAEFRLPDDRHFFANWWGVLQLWKIQMSVERLAGKTKIEEIELGFKGSLHEKNSYIGLVAQYVKGAKDEDFDRKLSIILAEQKVHSSGEDKDKYDTLEEIDDLREDLATFEYQLSILKSQKQEELSTYLGKLKSKIKLFSDPLQLRINEVLTKMEEVNVNIEQDKKYLELLEEIKSEKSLIYENRRKVNRNLESVIRKLQSQAKFITNEFDLSKIRTKFSENPPVILFVDDQADDGWSSVFQRIIYGGENKNFIVIQPSKDDTIQNIADKIVGVTNSKPVSLLIMDLRLLGERNNLNINDVSGIKVLEILKDYWFPCPLLITSASNKIISFKETKNLGANAYWTKQGLDEDNTDESTVNNYLRFIDLVHTLCYHEDLVLLNKKIWKNINRINNENSLFWWEKKFWTQDILKATIETKNGQEEFLFTKQQSASKSEIVEALISAADSFESSINQCIQKSTPITHESSLISLIILKFTQTLELIHSVDYFNDTLPLKTKMRFQLGNNLLIHYSELLKFRNKAAHEFNATIHDLNDFLGLFFSYIIYGNKKSHEDFTDERQPHEGNTYRSEISSIHKFKPLYYLKNPGLYLENDKPNILMNLKTNPDLDKNKLLVGVQIEFELLISTNGPTNYYAANARIV